MAKKLIIGENDLQTVNPQLAKEWNYEKNGELYPYMFTPGSGRRVWWRCSLNHEWEISIEKRNRGSNCPVCANKQVFIGYNDLASKNPELAKEWHEEKNGTLTAQNVTMNSGKRVWWLGKCGHEWQASVINRNKGTGCPICSNNMLLIGVNDLASVNPHLANEWHPEKNGELKPQNVISGAAKKVWWKCIEGHEWQTTIDSRVHGSGCPVCAKKDIGKIRAIPQKGINDLESQNLKLAKEWHPNKNGQWLPTMFLCNSNKKVWWQCEKGHEWEASINHRNKGAGCPYCANQKVMIGENDLKSQNPRLVEEWNYEKNIDIKVEEVTKSSGKKVWWLGKCGHEWQASVAHRSNGRGCPYCAGKKVLVGFNDLKTVNATWAEEWHPTKNGDLCPEMVTIKSHRKVWWLGKCGHEWQMTVANRNNNNCPICSNRQVLIGYNDLATLRPDLEKEWNYEKNRCITPYMYSIGSEKKVWWRCEKGHEWEAYIFNRSRDNNCPICVKELHTSFPEQAIYYYVKKLFNDALNGDKTIIGMELDIYIPSKNIAIEYDGRWHNTKDAFRVECKKNVLCAEKNIKLVRVREKGLAEHNDCICLTRADKKDLSLEIIIKEIMMILDKFVDVNIQRDRNEIYESYICSEKKNNLMFANPKLADEWHPTKNGYVTPKMVMQNSGKKAWWLGQCGHEWQAIIGSRNKGAGCPYCANQKVLIGYNDLNSCRPDLAKEWHMERNDGISPTMVVVTSNKKIWWRCCNGHAWQSTVRQRHMGAKCPYC